eukprot:CAMPEP_0201492416 /NCGR_PEP_ID=MMETSP0151_2-20130828/33020_1 /ASSEMBLY_ACC=CAM_ASM_000257 /TAXON_ID=200890 /ORGANISM="Paramoeba atlantica, Strain 621/1 / CCAP 1560/9" /LENGTH=291 /DNA_ID=CAMNT_0047879211 /DNA_START=113 /DNA_END=988 /DNA_ORIENTATION=-
MASSFKFAGCQLLVGEDKESNLENARKHIKEAVSSGAQVVCLPECFNSPYSTGAFPEYAEQFLDLKLNSSPTEKSGPSALFLSQIAKEHKIYLIGGSVPEREGEKIYNTCLVFDPNGNLLARHRKVHLFNVDVPGGIRFKESETLTAGSQITFFDTEYGRFGIGICYDVRFPEYAQVLALEKGCDFLCYPGAFNTTTGPLHWELLARARAVDNQVHVAMISPCRNPDSTYQAWGHSLVVDPWAKVVSTCEEKEAIIYADIDLSSANVVRQAIPVRTQRQNDQYSSPHSLDQ